MTTQSGSKGHGTTMVEVPVLSTDERAAFLAFLGEAEASVASGDFVDYEPETFRARLLETYRAAKLTKGA